MGAVEAELGERIVGLQIDDEDLAEWQTVADAVESVASCIADGDVDTGSVGSGAAS